MCWSVGGSSIQYTIRCIFHHDGLQAAAEIAVGLADVGGQLVVPALGDGLMQGSQIGVGSHLDLLLQRAPDIKVQRVQVW